MVAGIVSLCPADLFHQFEGFVGIARPFIKLYGTALIARLLVLGVVRDVEITVADGAESRRTPFEIPTPRIALRTMQSFGQQREYLASTAGIEPLQLAAAREPCAVVTK